VPAAVLAGGRTADREPSPPCKAGSAEGRFGEHLNEATITRLGSILECGNMCSHLDCRAANWCRSNALDTLVTASNNLAEELLKRARKTSGKITPSSPR